VCAYTDPVELQVGKVVVYGGHGAGRVVAREERGSGDSRREIVVLELAASLTVTLPVSVARECLRPLATELEMASVERTLRTTASTDEPVWLKRQKATRAKVALGEPIGLAEVVSDGARRSQGDSARLSVSERELYLKARRLLADEIGLVRGVDSSEAEEWIASQLAHAVR
jgi:RNA polymerase-interacting CarD/CdnL/TRCF family regulator